METTLLDVWNELGDRVRRFVASRVNDPATADDITQDVMLKVQAQLGDLPPDDKLPAWIFRTARNAITDHYRARAVRDHADIGDVDPAAVGGIAGDPREAVRDLLPCLARMVDQLPEPYREAMRLADLQGLSQQEVADRAGISLSGAKSRVQRARQMLRAMVEDCCDVERDGRGNVFDFEPTERTTRYCGTAGDDNESPPCGS